MKKLLMPALAFIVMGITSQASADWTPSSNRCLNDLLNHDQAWGRQQWAKRCRLENPYNYSTGTDSRFWHPMYTFEANNIYEMYGVHAYPVYMDPVTNTPWKGPGAAGTATAGYTGAQIANLPCTIKPVQVFHDGLCEP